MTKQEKIKEVYKYELLKDSINEKASLEFLENLLPYIDENGWVDSQNDEGHSGYLMESDLDIEFPLLRLKTLRGIEHNNGWHSTYENDFPEDNITVFWLNNENGEHETASLCHCDFNHKDYTHWHELPPKSPIY